MNKLLKKRQKVLYGILISVLSSIMVSALFLTGALKPVEWQADDLKMHWLRADAHANPDIVILLVDEASLATMDPLVGRWPWPRSVWADLLNFMQMGEAQSVAFDILFTERTLDDQGQASKQDLTLTYANRDTGIAVHAMQLLFDPTNPTPNKLLPEIFRTKFAINNVSGVPTSKNNTYYIPFNGLYQTAEHMAVVEFSPDKDGGYRRTHLFRDYNGHYYPVLSIASLMSRLKIHKVSESENHRSIKINDSSIPLDRHGNYLINFYNHFTTYSIGSVFASIQQMNLGNIEALYTDPRYVNPELFKNKIVYIGTSAVGLEDLKNTPMNDRWPGVFLHASIASNLLDHNFLTEANRSQVIITLVILSFLTLLLTLNRTSLSLQVGFPLLLAAVFAAGDIWLQSRFLFVMDIVPGLLAIFTTWLGITAYQSITEGREKRRVRNMLSQYVSPAAMSTILENYGNQALAEVGKEEEMTVVFSDIRSFTTISESLSPAQVVTLLNIHLDAMTQVTFDFHGTMDKFIGDATMAFWGAPLPNPNHALDATRAMIHMIRKLDDVNQKLNDMDVKPIRIGVGANTGKVILGNIGSTQKLDYTVIGDAVNLGSRLEGLTKQYGIKMLISEFTRAKVFEQIPCALIDQVRVKGKHKPVKIYLPLADIDDPERDIAFQTVIACEAAFNAYHQKQFEKAKSLYNVLPDEPFEQLKQVFLQRCDAYIQSPPPENWDGVFVATSK